MTIATVRPHTGRARRAEGNVRFFGADKPLFVPAVEFLRASALLIGTIAVAIILAGLGGWLAQLQGPPATR